jgi:hypothetical protein
MSLIEKVVILSGNLGCDGGEAFDAFKYVIDNGGIEGEATYRTRTPTKAVGIIRVTEWLEFLIIVLLRKEVRVPSAKQSLPLAL